MDETTYKSRRNKNGGREDRIIAAFTKQDIPISHKYAVIANKKFYLHIVSNISSGSELDKIKSVLDKKLNMQMNMVIDTDVAQLFINKNIKGVEPIFSFADAPSFQLHYSFDNSVSNAPVGYLLDLRNKVLVFIKRSNEAYAYKVMLDEIYEEGGWVDKLLSNMRNQFAAEINELKKLKANTNSVSPPTTSKNTTRKNSRRFLF